MIRNDIIKHFNEKSILTRNELLQFYLLSEPELNKNTFSWRIYYLKQKGIIKEVGRGLYSLCNKSDYLLQLNKVAVKVATHILKSFSDLTFCISNSDWVNEFTGHQYSNNFTIVEIEKDFLESVFFNLKEKFNNVFLKPNETELDRYISDIGNAIIIIPFITRAPIQKSRNNKYNAPSIEKLLVDVFTRNTPYFFLTNSEIEIIIRNAFRKYSINQTKLFAYAERRGKRKSLKDFLVKEKIFGKAND